MTFEDSKQPLNNNDRISKPKIGDTVVTNALSADPIQRGVVVRVFNSLAEDWSSDGETAWAMHDVNDSTGFRGRWYVIFEDGDGETYCAASYEVTEVFRV